MVSLPRASGKHDFLWYFLMKMHKVRRFNVLNYLKYYYTQKSEKRSLIIIFLVKNIFKKYNYALVQALSAR